MNKSKEFSDSTSTSRKNQSIFLYRIKIEEIQQKLLTPIQNQLYIYLNLTFDDNSEIQTPCINLTQKKFFQIQVQKQINKIQVINYQTMKKMAKIGLKGTAREFNILYKDPKHGLSLSILKKKLLSQLKISCQNKYSKSFIKMEERTFDISANVTDLQIDQIRS